MRKLASIQKVAELSAIAGADKICLASFENIGWKCIVKKEEFKVGDLCVYFETDSILPVLSCFFFLERYKYRLKTIKLKGTLSQGLAMPFQAMPEFDFTPFKIEDDVTAYIGVKKYDPEAVIEKEQSQSSKPKVWFEPFLKYAWFRKYVLPFLPKKTKGNFPVDLIASSDETRIQACPSMLYKYENDTFVQTEKLEGQSATFILNKKHWFKNDFIVCSRNLRLVHKNKSNWWQIAEDYDIQEVLECLMNLYPAKTWCIQGEIIGPDIQGNIYNLKKLTLRVFRLKKINKDGSVKFFDPIEGSKILEPYGLSWCPIIGSRTLKDLKMESILELADGESKLYPTPREGLVWSKLDDPNISFKTVSNKYLILHDK